MRAFGLIPSLLFIAMSGAAIAAVRPEPVHPERKNLPPNLRRDLVIGDLEAILSGPTSPTSITTAPYPSSRDGLCQRDVLSLRYEREEERGGKSSVRPVGIGWVITEYHFLGFEKIVSRDIWTQKCKNLSGQQVYWARSDDETTADFALGHLDIAIADARKNEHVTINCDALQDDAIESRCTSEFLDAASQVSSASKCRNQPAGTRSQCYTFDMAKYEVTIVRTYGQVANGGYSTVIEMKYAPIVTF